MIYKLKPLKQIEQEDGSVRITSPTHAYVIRDNRITYHNLHTLSTGERECNSFNECVEWINNVHVPSGLTVFFNKVE